MAGSNEADPLDDLPGEDAAQAAREALAAAMARKRDPDEPPRGAGNKPASGGRSASGPLRRPPPWRRPPPPGRPQSQARRSGGVQRVVRPSGRFTPPDRTPGGVQRTLRPAGGAPAGPKASGPAPAVPPRPTQKRLRRFAELGWQAQAGPGTDALAVDLGVESLCVSTFEGGRFEQVQDQAQPTLVKVEDPHAFRSLQGFSLSYGVDVLERWPSQNVLRGTHGSLLLPSQIGLVEFPAEHVLAALLTKVRDERKKSPKQLVVTLPTFLPSDRDQRIREKVASKRKGGFRGVSAPLAAAYFYLTPALDGFPAEGSSLRAWSHEALRAGRVLVLDWGASGLQYGLVGVRRGQGQRPTELRLPLAGIWPSLGGHRLTLALVNDLKEQLIDAIIEAGPSEELVPIPLLKPGAREVPRPPGYDEAFEVLRYLGKGPVSADQEEVRRKLRDLLFPTAWRFPPGKEPAGFAPYRRMAVMHFKALWRIAERLKRLLLSDPPRYRQRRTIPWSLERLDTPFVSHLEARGLEYPVERFLERVERGLRQCLRHIDRRLRRRGVRGPVPLALTGMQSCTPLLEEAIEQAATREGERALKEVAICPASSDPLELKSAVNRGAALLNRDKRKVDLGAPVDMLPFSVEIADCLGNVPVFTAGPIDELVVFQRRMRVEEGFPQFEFYLYNSEDGTQWGSWGAIDFHKPFEFTERDRVFAVDPSYGFGSELPLLRDLKGDEGRDLAKRCFDRSTPGATSGMISFRGYAPHQSPEARRLLHFLEYGLTGEFHRKVYLLEREFLPPPRRFDYVYQRYYLSRSQELLVVREWWAPGPGGTLVRNKTLHTCQGRTEANTILGLEWGSY